MILIYYFYKFRTKIEIEKAMNNFNNIFNYHSVEKLRELIQEDNDKKNENRRNNNNQNANNNQKRDKKVQKENTINN